MTEPFGKVVTSTSSLSVDFMLFLVLAIVGKLVVVENMPVLVIQHVNI